ncbi:Uncharacterised protein [Bordetella pertussis]|nr:Uncharacterised protein [Bordetella pertussis]
MLARIDGRLTGAAPVSGSKGAVPRCWSRVSMWRDSSVMFG